VPWNGYRPHPCERAHGRSDAMPLVRYGRAVSRTGLYRHFLASAWFLFVWSREAARVYPGDKGHIPPKKIGEHGDAGFCDVMEVF